MNDSHRAVLVVYPNPASSKDPGAPRRVDVLLALERIRVASKGVFDYAAPASPDGTWILEVRL